MCWNSLWWFQPFEKYATVKLDHFPKFRGGKTKIFETTATTRCFFRSMNLPYDLLARNRLRETSIVSCVSMFGIFPYLFISVYYNTFHDLGVLRYPSRQFLIPLFQGCRIVLEPAQESWICQVWQCIPCNLGSRSWTPNLICFFVQKKNTHTYHSKKQKIGVISSLSQKDAITKVQNFNFPTL